VNDYERPQMDDQPAPPGGTEGPRLPFGLSLQAVATGLLILAVLAIAWIFFGPQGGEEPVPGLATATPRAATAVSAATAPSAPVAAATTRPTTPLSGATFPAVAGATAAATLATGPVTGGTAAAGIAAGGFIRVQGTGGLGLRLRFGPGADYLTIRIVSDGETLRVSGNPETAEGTTWWRLQDQIGNVGWGAQEYLQPVAPPVNWNPPAASPTFGSSEGETPTP
jgi:hypothetical protein